MSDPPIPPTKPAPSKEAKGAGTSAPAAVQPPAGSTEVGESMSFEVEVLAHVATSVVAGEIADRVRGVLPGNAVSQVVYLDPTLASALSLKRTFDSQIAMLAEAFGSAKEIAETGLATLEGRRPVPPPSTQPSPGGAEASAEGLEMAAVGGATLALSAVANLVSLFRVDTSYYGRAAEVSEQALVMEITRKLIPHRARIRFRWPGLGAPVLGNGARVSSFLGQLNQLTRMSGAALVAVHELATAVHELKDEDPRLPPARLALDGAHDQYDGASEILAQVRQDFLGGGSADGSSPAHLLQMAADTLAAIEADNAGKTYFLVARVETAGGSYRTRKHLWQVLTGEEPLSVSGGVVVSFALLDDAAEFVAAGTLRQREGYHEMPAGSSSFGQEGESG